MDGIVFHPEAPGVRYCRTDMGGAYRWDAASNQWTPLLDWISLDESNLQGVESIAIDPQNPQNVYIACGTYTSSSNGAILCSYDGGRTFARVDVPFTMGGNENGRGNGGTDDGGPAEWEYHLYGNPFAWFVAQYG